MPSEKAIQEAAGCWCDPRTSDRTMDVALATVIAEKIDQYRDALIWASGSPSFAPGGEARTGWEQVTEALL